MERDIDNKLVRALFVRTPSLERVQKLVAMGANVNARDPISLSCPCKRCRKMKAKEAWKPESNRYVSTNTVLMHAAVKGMPKQIVEFLINSGADVEASTKDGKTVLMNAVFFGAEEPILELLLAHGADVHRTDSTNMTALMCALDGFGNNEDTVRLLVEHGTDVNAKDVFERPVLMHALVNSRTPIKLIHYLDSCGAVLEYWDDELFWEVAWRGSPAAVSFMLSNGANPNAVAFDNRTVLDWVETWIREELGRHDGDKYTVRFRRERIDQHSKTFKILVQAGAKRMSDLDIA